MKNIFALGLQKKKVNGDASANNKQTTAIWKCSCTFGVFTRNVAATDNQLMTWEQ